MTQQQENLQRIAGELKLSPLMGLDPNNQEALEALVQEAITLSQQYNIDTSNREAVKMLALSLNHWGSGFATEAWAERILKDEQGDDLLKVQELHLYKLFENAGPEAVDFATYCILKFKRRLPSMKYGNAEIHVASDLGLKIAAAHGIHDLLNSYSCVELALLCAGNFIDNPACWPMKAIFNDAQKTAEEKISASYTWLNENINSVYASLKK